MHLYYSHTGGLYVEPRYKESQTCKVCGDRDTYIGEAETRTAARQIVSRFCRETGYERPERAERMIQAVFQTKKPGH